MSDKVKEMMDKRCEACFAPLDEARQCPACGADNTQRPLRYRFFAAKIFAECPACKHQCPVNGALRRTQCEQCLTDLKLVAIWSALADMLKDFFKFQRRFGAVDLGGSNWKCELEAQAPSCRKCQQPLPAARISLKTDGPYPCPGCGEPATVFPPPPWLKEVFPKAEQLFDTERELDATDAPDAPDGQPIVSPAQEVKPTFFQCPGCGGNLTLTADAERTITCEYCEATAYLPDPLWRQLHPVKKAEPWIIRVRAPKEKKAKSR